MRAMRGAGQRGAGQRGAGLGTRVVTVKPPFRDPLLWLMETHYYTNIDTLI